MKRRSSPRSTTPSSRRLRSATPKHARVEELPLPRLVFDKQDDSELDTFKARVREYWQNNQSEHSKSSEAISDLKTDAQAALTQLLGIREGLQNGVDLCIQLLTWQKSFQVPDEALRLPRQSLAALEMQMTPQAARLSMADELKLQKKRTAILDHAIERAIQSITAAEASIASTSTATHANELTSLLQSGSILLVPDKLELYFALGSLVHNKALMRPLAMENALGIPQMHLRLSIRHADQAWLVYEEPVKAVRLSDTLARIQTLQENAMKDQMIEDIIHEARQKGVSYFESKTEYPGRGVQLQLGDWNVNLECRKTFEPQCETQNGSGKANWLKMVILELIARRDGALDLIEEWIRWMTFIDEVCSNVKRLHALCKSTGYICRAEVKMLDMQNLQARRTSRGTRPPLIGSIDFELESERSVIQLSNDGEQPVVIEGSAVSQLTFAKSEFQEAWKRHVSATLMTVIRLSFVDRDDQFGSDPQGFIYCLHFSSKPVKRGNARPERGASRSQKKHTMTVDFEEQSLVCTVRSGSDVSVWRSGDKPKIEAWLRSL